MFKTLLLSIDVNAAEGAERVAQAAVAMALSEGAKLHILNVVPDGGMPIVSASLGPDHTQEVLAQAKSELETWAATAVPDTIERDLHVTQGTVYDQIIKVAQSLEVDAIFVGAHRPELRDYLIGPNAARVARHALQSVFVIR